MTDKPIVLAFTDEAGRRGYVRDLKASTDTLISLMCSVLVPKPHIDRVRQAFQPAHKQFAAAAPTNAKLHITDAFKKGNDAWRPVAEQSRRQIFRAMHDNGVFLTFSACRMKVSREMHELLETLKANAKAQSRSEYVVQGSNRPSADQIDDDIVINLALMVEAFAEKFKAGAADFLFDELDRVVADRYQTIIASLRDIENKTEKVRARNLVTGKFVEGEIRFKAPSGLNLKLVRNVEVVGKSDPIIFATDCVTNYLSWHLSQLADSAPLNETSSVSGWELAPLTFVAPANSLFDKI
jgi:hypothetical protein